MQGMWWEDVGGGKMSVAEELSRKAKQVKLHHSQQDDRHVPNKKNLGTSKSSSVHYTRYGRVWFSV